MVGLSAYYIFRVVWACVLMVFVCWGFTVWNSVHSNDENKWEINIRKLDRIERYFSPLSFYFRNEDVVHVTGASNTCCKLIFFCSFFFIFMHFLAYFWFFRFLLFPAISMSIRFFSYFQCFKPFWCKPKAANSSNDPFFSRFGRFIARSDTHLARVYSSAVEIRCLKALSIWLRENEYNDAKRIDTLVEYSRKNENCARVVRQQPERMKKRTTSDDARSKKSPRSSFARSDEWEFLRQTTRFIVVCKRRNRSETPNNIFRESKTKTKRSAAAAHNKICAAANDNDSNSDNKPKPNATKSKRIERTDANNATKPFALYKVDSVYHECGTRQLRSYSTKRQLCFCVAFEWAKRSVAVCFTFTLSFTHCDVSQLRETVWRWILSLVHWDNILQKRPATIFEK